MIRQGLSCMLCWAALVLPIQAKEESQGVVVFQDEHGHPLAGSNMDVYYYDSYQTSLTSDAKGKIYLRDLPYGSYTLVQSLAASGYEKSDKRITFVYDGSAKKGKTWNIINKQMMGKVHVQVQDEQHKQIGGIVFHLLDEKGKEVKQVSSKAGRLTLPVLPVGEYRLHLDEAESRYIQKQDVHFAITPYNYKQDYTLTLHMKKAVPKTSIAAIVYLVGFGIIVLLIFLICFFRKHSVTQFLDDFVV